MYLLFSAQTLACFITAQIIGILWGTGTGSPEKLWLPRPWKCSGLGWMGLWATWSSGRCPCPWQGLGTRWSLKSLPTQPILWFYDFSFYSAYWNCKAQNSADAEVPRCLRRSELCGLVLLLSIWVVLVCWSFVESCCSPFQPLYQWLWELVVGSTLNSLLCFALQVQ